MDNTLQDYKQKFIEFLAKSGALEGERRLKSGRVSPYFINTGNFYDGEALIQLGEAYAGTVTSRFQADEYTVIFGPAYKGITLCCETTAALFKRHGIKKNYSFNRKESKLHGDTGELVGYKLGNGDGIIIVDDVFTTGETKYEMLELIKSIAPEAKVIGLLIAVDRMEKDTQGDDAMATFSTKSGVPVYSIVTIREIISHLHNREIEGRVYIDDARKHTIEEYLRQYGVARD